MYKTLLLIISRGKPGQKRKHKDDKFGFGGKKRKMKKNSVESSAEAHTDFRKNIHGKKFQPGKMVSYGGHVLIFELCFSFF